MNKVQIVLNFPKYYYNTNPMSISEIKEFLDKIGYYSFYFAIDASAASKHEQSIYSDGLEELYEYCDTKESKKEDPEYNDLLNYENFYYDATPTNLDIPLAEFYQNLSDEKIYFMGYNIKISHDDMVEQFKNIKAEPASIKEFKSFLDNTESLNPKLVTDNIPCIVYYNSRINENKLEYFILDGYNYLKNVLATNPESNIAVKKYYFNM